MTEEFIEYRLHHSCGHDSVRSFLHKKTPEQIKELESWRCDACRNKEIQHVKITRNGAETTSTIEIENNK